MQSRRQHDSQFTRNSLDIVLGIVGGFVGLIWGGLSLIVGGYETFKLENSLIGAIYPTSPQGREDSDDDKGDAGNPNDGAPKT